MAEKKRIYIVCATGVATSSMLKVKINEFFEDKPVDIKVNQYRVTELSPSRIDADVIVATTGVPDDIKEVVPVIDGTPLVTGRGERETLERLLELLTE
jgi:PTS system galactitol-specific IIB component